MIDICAPPGLELHSLTLSYQGRTLFERLSLSLQAEQCTALLGASGIGKTSLLRIAAGLLKPDSGEVRASDGLKLAGRVAWMGQQDLLYPWLKALDNITLGSRLRGEQPDISRALALLNSVGLKNQRNTLPKDLSGGMRQRVALARTLYENHPIVLMDEPFSALDAITRASMQELAAELLRGRTTLLVTHDPFEACRIANNIYVMAGRPARIGPEIKISGLPPRAPDDEALLHTQGNLLRSLLAGHTP